MFRASPGCGRCPRPPARPEASPPCCGLPTPGPCQRRPPGPGWPSSKCSDVGLDLLADLEAGLSGCRGGERERLKETVQHYLDTGSITATAQQLFCHRNTILNRISRFQDLTGVDLAVPAQTARLVVAWA